MEKVKLTREQAEMIKNHKEAKEFERLMQKHRMKGLPTHIDELTTQQVVDAYFDGYEVEETFKVGDWVMHELSKWLGEVTRIYEDELNVLRLGDGYIWNKKYVRHATPEEIAEEKQRRWWARHGRDVYEFKAGDLIKCEDTTSEVESPEEDLIWIKMNGAKGTLPEKLYQGIEVICFAEDRKDLEA